MSISKIDEILERLYELQKDLEEEIDNVLSEKRELFRYNFEKGKLKFEEGMRALHRAQRTGVWQYVRNAEVKHILVAPIIYLLFVPIILVDFSVSLYQLICFRVYGIPL